MQFEDPKIFFTIKLIEAQQEISQLLNNGGESEAAREMAIMLLRINIPDNEKEMIALRKKLTPNNYHVFQVEQVYSFYAQINAYLNHTYFADYHRAKPKFEGEGKL